MDSWYERLADDPNVPTLVYYGYLAEKATLSGCFISSILYGMLVMLFLQCMVALFSPVHRGGEGIKWWLVSYTVAVFSFVTVYIATNLHIQSVSFVDNRETGAVYRGPMQYQAAVRSTALGLILDLMFNLNNWLADGLLIYRCYIIYSTNLWIIAIPCLLYLGSLGMGIVVLIFQVRSVASWTFINARFGIPYLSFSVSLNILLTLMIVIRLVLHSRDMRAATGSPVGISGLYKAICTMLIESCALFSVSSLLVIGLLVGGGSMSIYDFMYLPGSYAVDVFFPILAVTQVIAPLLVIQRVANRSALTSQTIITGQISSFNVRKRGESRGSDGTPLGGYPTSPADERGNKSDELGIMVETRTDPHLDGGV